MNVNKIVCIFFFLCSFSFFAQEIEWIETQATIKNIEIKGTKRAREYATILYTTVKGDTLLGQVELLRLPFLGSFKSEGDVIDVQYNKAEPIRVETISEGFINTYGMYILIALGIIFSIKNIVKGSRGNTY